MACPIWKFEPIYANVHIALSLSKYEGVSLDPKCLDDNTRTILTMVVLQTIVEPITSFIGKWR
jgi:hypothetical protein